MTQPKEPLESLYPQKEDLFTLAGVEVKAATEAFRKIQLFTLAGVEMNAATEAFRKIQKSLESIATLSRALDHLSPPPPEPNWATDPLGISDWLNNAWFDLRLQFYSAVDSAGRGLCDICGVVLDFGYSVEEWAQNRIDEL